VKDVRKGEKKQANVRESARARARDGERGKSKG